jgi:hypothetical protein
MTGFLLKGALVEFKPTFGPVPVPNVIVFQYNPETMTHTWTQPEPARTAGSETGNPLAVKGQPGEAFSFTIAMDARDEIADGSAPAAALAQASGVYSRLAALELLLYPTGASRPGLTGTVSAAVTSALRGARPGVTRTIPRSVLPVTLFIWGPGRIVPVRVNDLVITEQLYDAALNPVYAQAQVTLRVLTPAELAAASVDDRVLGGLATIAYRYTLTLRQALAVANLANATESVIGMIPR